MSESGRQSKPRTVDSERKEDNTTEALLGRLARPPVTWTIVMLTASLLAAVEVSRSSSGKVVTSFHVGDASLVALALIWLPLLLRVFALVGGSFKAGGMEASVHGVLSQGEAINISVKARQVATAGDEVERKLAAQDLEDSVNRLVDASSPESTLDDAVLKQLAREYERLRRELPPGNRRTSAMTRIVNEARTRAAWAPHMARQATHELLQSRRPGDRLVALGLAQETGDATVFDEVLGLVSGSASAFEMFHALLALQEMSQGLSDLQRARAIQVLNVETDDPRAVGVRTDPGLPSLLVRTIRILAGEE